MLRRQIAVQQEGTDPIHTLLRFAVAEPDPLAVGATLSEKESVRIDLCPVFQPFPYAAGILLREFYFRA